MSLGPAAMGVTPGSDVIGDELDDGQRARDPIDGDGPRLARCVRGPGQQVLVAIGHRALDAQRTVDDGRLVGCPVGLLDRRCRGARCQAGAVHRLCGDCSRAGDGPANKQQVRSSARMRVIGRAFVAVRNTRYGPAHPVRPQETFDVPDTQRPCRPRPQLASVDPRPLQ